MADEQATTKPKRGRKRAARGKLRKSQIIDNIVVEESFQLAIPEADDQTGEGCYISTTVNSTKYYGVLIDQASLKAASLLFFKDEASGLELNRKMEYFSKKREAEIEPDSGTIVPTAEPSAKRPRLVMPSSNDLVSESINGDIARQIQKFRYVRSEGDLPGYRLLLATFADVAAASEDDPDRFQMIERACRAGGDFVGEYFYQYETPNTTLQVTKTSRSPDNKGFRMSMGFEYFLQNTMLPQWFPLANTSTGQQQVLNILNMKKDSNGNVIYNQKAKPDFESSFLARAETIPMEPRSRFRTCVVGAGIAGLSCCLEIFRICERERIDVEVVLVEGRSRIGGRLLTDRDTFTMNDGVTPFPVDLGASWIHGINLNPLAIVAKEAGVDVVTTSEDVTMFEAGMKEVDSSKDEQAGRLFDKLLDFATDDCWSSTKWQAETDKSQSAVRWYASKLGDSLDGQVDDRIPPMSTPPPHRQSQDVSVDIAIGRAISHHMLVDFAVLSEEERRMLTWNLKNVEYALGANVQDLSMMYWDIDDRHAFEGDHVLLRQGYSTVVEHLHRLLDQRGDRFRCELEFKVGRVEYNRKSSTASYFGTEDTGRKFIELSDTCCVSSEDGTRRVKCDFLVSTVPLGVLKASISDDSRKSGISFEPELPFVKRDAIESVGFGLLNKVYLQFPFPFWRRNNILAPGQTQFGNASGVHPHHYMFLDVGEALGLQCGESSVLMSLISGREAASCEVMTNDAVVGEIMETLRTLFSQIDVPDPLAVKITNWGSDNFSRGSYTYLAPGSTDQDFETLQSPLNGNGDSVLLEKSETMRLFFAGEHTTALHPSMAHGAMLSGVRAAKEVTDSMTIRVNGDHNFDQVIPLAMFRYMNPKREMRCAFCLRVGSTAREGSLLAFKKGSRQVLCHTNCAENSPEVEVSEGKWKDVLTAMNRSRSIQCYLCKKAGASIGCSNGGCDRCYHYSCGEDTGWRFDVDGKEFYCNLHRNIEMEACRRVSMRYLLSLSRSPDFLCCLCGQSGGVHAGGLLAYQRFPDYSLHSNVIVVHENCAKYSNVIEIDEDMESKIENELKNIFKVVDAARPCDLCQKPGATILCSRPDCGSCFHFACAESIVPDFAKRGQAIRLRCERHSDLKSLVHLKTNRPIGPFAFSANSANGTNAFRDPAKTDESDGKNIDDVVEDAAMMPSDMPLATRKQIKGDETVGDSTRIVRVHRRSTSTPWDFELYALERDDTKSRLLTIARCSCEELEVGDYLTALNGIKIGSFELDTLQKALSYLKQEIEMLMEVRRPEKRSRRWV